MLSHTLDHGRIRWGDQVLCSPQNLHIKISRQCWGWANQRAYLLENAILHYRRLMIPKQAHFYYMTTALHRSGKTSLIQTNLWLLTMLTMLSKHYQPMTNFSQSAWPILNYDLIIPEYEKFKRCGLPRLSSLKLVWGGGGRGSLVKVKQLI